MSLRLKLVLALVLLSATATISIGVWNYVATADRLYDEIDTSLSAAARNTADLASREPRRTRTPRPDVADLGPLGPRPRSFEQILFQQLDSRGNAVVTPASGALPIDDQDSALATGALAGARTRDVTLDGELYRLHTESLGNGAGAVQVARSLAETRRVLDSLRDFTALAVLAVITAAAMIGWLIAYEVTRRLVRLTGVAEQVATTGRLDIGVPVSGNDETGRLGTAFNEMLEALAASRDAQQRLVQDAGHELRTPLTSLRTNISVLRRHDDLAPGTRARVLDDLDAETRELTALANELVDLATETRPDEPEDPVALGPLVTRLAERARRRTGRAISVDVDGTVVTGRPLALERAVANLVDNAAKFSEAGTPIEVSVRTGRVEVCDRGPGIAEADLPHVFDRFYRALDARARPGSGLGLAIVRDVAESHRGSVFAENRAGGGTRLGFEIPSLPDESIPT